MDKEKQIERIQAWARKLPQRPIGVYGFGSYFSDNENLQSDVDIAVLFPRPVVSSQRWKLQNQLADRLKKNVDLVDLRTANTVLRHQIVSTGRRIACNDPRSCDVFETYAYSSYCRFNEERSQILRDILKRGSIYGG